MDQLNMNNVKHHEKINTHTQITNSNTIQRSGLLVFFEKAIFAAPNLSQFGEHQILGPNLPKKYE